MVKGIIFDMDGVIFDTERFSTMGWLKCGDRRNCCREQILREETAKIIAETEV